MLNGETHVKASRSYLCLLSESGMHLLSWWWSQREWTSRVILTANNRLSTLPIRQTQNNNTWPLSRRNHACSTDQRREFAILFVYVVQGISYTNNGPTWMYVCTVCQYFVLQFFQFSCRSRPKLSSSREWKLTVGLEHVSLYVFEITHHQFIVQVCM